MISNRRGVICIARLALVVILAILSTSKPARGADPKPAPRLDRDVEVQVVDSVSKEPIAGAAVTINMSGAQSRKDQTEDKGRVWVLLPEKDPSYLNIRVKMDGYVNNQIEYREGDAIPATSRIELVRGISIGGTIQDEQGNAIAGVEMTCMFPGGDAAMRKRMNFYETVRASSDDQGKWRCDGIPGDLKEITIKIIHPDFVSDGFNDYMSKPPPMEQLRAMKGVIVMKRGLSLSGVVLDEAGKAIQNASVMNGVERYGAQVAKSFTDAEGRFVLRNLREGAQTLSVTAKQHAPTSKEIKLAKDTPPLEFRLGKGNIIRGKVVDVTGKPIGGVKVGISSLFGETKWQWNANTKGDGTFVWAEAPAEEVIFEVMKQGYVSVRDFKMKPSDKEYAITLRPPQKIHGSVVDAQTGKPLENFLVVPGRKEYEYSPVSWRRSDMKKGQEGQYETEFTESALAWQVRIEAPGYLPATSPAYKPDQTDVVFDAKLVKGTGPAGIVRRPDGTPAAGVELVLATPSSQVQIHNGAFEHYTQTTKTAADGKFEFAPQTDPFVVLAIGDDGYAEVTPEQLKASSDVKLQPWGKVVGKVKRGSKPWPDQTVMMEYETRYDGMAPRIDTRYETKSDQDGNFTFERVVPKDARVGRQQYLWKSATRGSYYISHQEKITVKPGQTVNVQVGGKGRPIVGKIIVPNDPVSQAWRLEANLENNWQPPKQPDGSDEWTQEQWKEWSKSQKDAQLARANARRYYAFPIDENRSFRAEDVAPGIYRLLVSAIDDNHRSLASAQLEVKVDEIPGGQSDEPIEVGTLELTPGKLLKVGSELPTTTFKTIDGPAVNLADFKGKYVLIHFWTSVNKQFAPELAALTEIYEQSAKDGRLVIIGINTNSIPASGKAFAEKNGMKWVHAYVGMNTTIYQDLKIQEFPPHLLIGPDGKLISNVTKTEDLKAEVSRAVGKAAQ